MESTITVLRAVSAVFFRRLLTRFGGIALIIFIVLFAIVGLLMVRVDTWWWVALALLTPLAILVWAIWTALWLISGRIAHRRLTSAESKAVWQFTDKIFTVAERARTPLPVLGVQLAKDIVFKKGESNILSQTIEDSKTLRSEFSQLRTQLSSDGFVEDE